MKPYRVARLHGHVVYLAAPQKGVIEAGYMAPLVAYCEAERRCQWDELLDWVSAETGEPIENLLDAVSSVVSVPRLRLAMTPESGAMRAGLPSAWLIAAAVSAYRSAAVR